MVIVEKAEEGGFYAHVPDLPGCYSQGESLAETLENIRGSMEAWLEAAREHGYTLPGDEVLRAEIAVDVPA
jgi:predicted RNase H-like HicB family nuclease